MLESTANLPTDADRIRAIETRFAEYEHRLLEQEHRFLVAFNAWRDARHDPAQAKERRAARRALAWILWHRVTRPSTLGAAVVLSGSIWLVGTQLSSNDYEAIQAYASLLDAHDKTAQQAAVLVERVPSLLRSAEHAEPSVRAVILDEVAALTQEIEPYVRQINVINAPVGGFSDLPPRFAKVANLFADTSKRVFGSSFYARQIEAVGSPLLGRPTSPERGLILRQASRTGLLNELLGEGATFQFAEAVGWRIRDSDITETLSLHGSVLTNCIIRNVNFSQVNLGWTDMSECRWSGSVGPASSLHRTVLEKADIRGLDVTWPQLEQACLDAGTRVPARFEEELSHYKASDECATVPRGRAQVERRFTSS